MATMNSSYATFAGVPLVQDLNFFERSWVGWYKWMENDVIATGVMSFIIHEFFYFGRSLPWTIIDRIPYFRRYKIQDTKMPSDKEQWECTKAVLFSHFTIELPQIVLFHPLAEWCGMSTGIPFPGMKTIAYQVAIFLVLEDTWHYWMHRCLHYGPLYRRIHKMHHTFSAPFGLAAEYASNVEVMLLGLGTVGMPILWCLLSGGNLHIVTMYIWIICRLFQAIDAHSGYDLPWSLCKILPFWAGAAHHDLHHEHFQGNYSSSFRWWDYLLDTEAGPEARKRRLAKKAKAKAM